MWATPQSYSENKELHRLFQIQNKALVINSLSQGANASWHRIIRGTNGFAPRSSALTLHPHCWKQRATPHSSWGLGTCVFSCGIYKAQPLWQPLPAPGTGRSAPCVSPHNPTKTREHTPLSFSLFLILSRNNSWLFAPEHWEGFLEKEKCRMLPRLPGFWCDYKYKKQQLLGPLPTQWL